MSKPTPAPTPEVMQALETLERATSPVELGPSYQTLLDWRRRHPLGVFARNAAAPFAALAFGSLFLLSLRYLDFEVTEYWRGFLNGVWIASLVWSLSAWITSRPDSTAVSIETRIEAAIDRWRHAAPAMREIPR